MPPNSRSDENVLSIGGRERGETREVLFLIGGGHRLSLASEVVSAIADKQVNCRLTMVVAQTTEGQRFRQLLERVGGQLIQNLSSAEMAEQMVDADFALATPSTVAWELSCLGVPAAFLRVADNQARVEAWLRESGITTVCTRGLALVEAIEEWSQATPAARRTRLSAWESLIDGLGAKRCVDVLADA